MAHTIKVMHEVEAEEVPATAQGHEAWLERAATDMLRTLPRLVRAVKHQSRFSETYGPLHELGASQVMVLFNLLEGRKLTSELSRNFNVTSPTMSRIVDALVEKGYVERQPDQEDRRCIYLQLTPEGVALATNAREQSRKALASYLSPLNEGQLSEIVGAFGHLQQLLPDGGEEQLNCPMRTLGGMEIATEG